MCSIFKREALAELFRQAKLLIIDEVTMGHRHVLEAVAEPYKISEIVMLCLGD